jgi:hypothetical protein
LDQDANPVVLEQEVAWFAERARPSDEVIAVSRHPRQRAR